MLEIFWESPHQHNDYVVQALAMHVSASNRRLQCTIVGLLGFLTSRSLH